MKKLPAKRPKSGWRGAEREVGEIYRQVPTPAPRPAAAPAAVCAYAIHPGNFMLAHSHEATHLSLSYIYSCSSERAQMKQCIIFRRKKKNQKPTLPSLMPVKGAACPGTASYPGPAEGCRLLQPCRANIRGRGKRPVSPSHHEMSQPDRRNRGGLSAALTRLWLGVSPPLPDPRSYFFTTTRSSPNSALPTPALSSCLCLSSEFFTPGNVHPTEH